MTTVALIGAGQIGSRHLQALARLEADITVIDPSSASLDRARELAGKSDIRYATQLDQLGPAIDVAIVACSARERRSVVESLLAGRKVGALVLEKVLFQKIEDYEAVGALLKERGVRAWVNCPRRLWPFYQALRERTRGNPVQL